MSERGLMVVDMQEKFLTVPHNNVNAKNIPKLINNTCDAVSDTLQRGEKVFVVKFDGCGENVSQIEKAINGKGITILKDQPYFLIGKQKIEEKYGIGRDAFKDITEISLSGVYTLYCVREAFRTLQELGIKSQLILGATLNMCHGITQLDEVTKWYKMAGLKAKFRGVQEGKDYLEDYL